MKNIKINLKDKNISKLYSQLKDPVLKVEKIEYKNGAILSVTDLGAKDRLIIIYYNGIAELIYKNESQRFTCNIYQNVLYNYFSEGNKRFMLQTARQIYDFFVEHSKRWSSFKSFSVITDIILCADTGAVIKVEGY